jgi:hypothetical protein
MMGLRSCMTGPSWRRAMTCDVKREGVGYVDFG